MENTKVKWQGGNLEILYFIALPLKRSSKDLLKKNKKPSTDRKAWPFSRSFYQSRSSYRLYLLSASLVWDWCRRPFTARENSTLVHGEWPKFKLSMCKPYLPNLPALFQNHSSALTNDSFRSVLLWELSTFLEICTKDIILFSSRDLASCQGLE